MFAAILPANLGRNPIFWSESAWLENVSTRAFVLRHRAPGSVLPKSGHSDNRFRVHILLTYSAKFQRFAAPSLGVALILLGQPAFSADPQPVQSVPRSESAVQWHPDAGFTSLFNGKDLSGWSYNPTEVFDGKLVASDERYSAGDGILTVHPHTAGPRLRQLWTVQTFPKNFHLKLEFRASVNADSGIFLRKPQLQCRDYWVAGPYYKLGNYKPQDWNTIEVLVKDNVAHCTCNGEVLEEALKLPADGPVGLEADRGTMEYRHIQIKETE